MCKEQLVPFFFFYKCMNTQIKFNYSFGILQSITFARLVVKGWRRKHLHSKERSQFIISGNNFFQLKEGWKLFIFYFFFTFLRKLFSNSFSFGPRASCNCIVSDTVKSDFSIPFTCTARKEKREQGECQLECISLQELHSKGCRRRWVVSRLAIRTSQ